MSATMRCWPCRSEPLHRQEGVTTLSGDDYRGVILYDIDRTGRFSAITVAYISFTNTKLDGRTHDMGMPH